ncbi:hypothetical protein [Dichotomicrobium thermohalophilum]|uniref:Spore coat protein U-like protein n=1 Tax=Dichotomicrobium thermohalophilum TaxID=933063 RepID=A0A397Q5G0_9HYPH|nr:hypothetical protein [Dichotomicrobium thermohalophilum]RIA56342.1 hypothetical protein BXY53_1446 [Dichotomicrobium thermohalophilum]
MIIKKRGRFSANPVIAMGVAAVALSLSGASADANDVTATETVTIRADIPKICEFDSSFGDLDLPLTASGRPNAMQALTADATITCNTTASVELESQHGAVVHHGVEILGNQSALGTEYLTSFDYTATLKQNGTQVVQLDTSSTSGTGTPESISAASAFGGAMPTSLPLTLEVVPEEVSGVLQSGTYVDDLKVKIIPQ